MKVEPTKFNLTSLPLCLEVVGIRTQEIAAQVCDRNLYTTNRQNDSEARRWSYYLYDIVRIPTTARQSGSEVRLVVRNGHSKS